MTTVNSVRTELAAGWRTLLAATIGFGTGLSSLPFYTNGLFVPELEQAFGWTRGQLADLALIGAVLTILTAPLVGSIVDRFGVRVPATVSLLAMAASYFAMSNVGSQYATYLLIWVGMYVLAAASTAVSFTRAVTHTFDRIRGVALGVVLGGAGLTAFIVPSTMGKLVAEDWRAGYAILALVSLIGAVAVFVLIKGRGSGSTAAKPVVAKATFREVLPLVRTWHFARLFLAFLMVALAIGGLPVHMVAMLRDAGVSPASAAATMSYLGIALIVGRVGTGLLVDRFFAPKVAAGMMVLTAGGFATFALGGPDLAVAATIAVGLALGAEVDLIGYLTSRYFGLRLYGRIFGLFYSGFLIGMGVSPVLVDKLRLAAGGYQAALVLSIALLLATAALFVTAPKFPAVTRTEKRAEPTPA